MIEIIGGQKGEQEPLVWRELPKNLRQIGETKEKKIYLEDYVVTYLGRLSRPGQAYARGAILFGNLYQTEEGIAVFISGAMEAQNLELDMDETIFNEEIWRELLKQGEKYFPKQKVMGWFLSRMGFSVEMNQKIVNTHLKNFPGNHRILYMIDSLEREDAIYLCENNQMIRQKGYYIYYEKNPAMQEYMLSDQVADKARVEQEKKNTEIRRDQKIVNGYRKRNHYSKKTKKQDTQLRLARMACGLMIILMSVYIYTQLSERHFPGGDLKEYVKETMGRVLEQKEKVEEEVLGETKTTDAVEGAKSDMESETQEGNGTNQREQKEEKVQGDTSSQAEQKESQLTSEGTKETVEEDASTKQENSTEETLSTGVSQKPLYYTVEKGDTLASISRKMYLSDKYTKQIAWANSLENENEIYEGQKILIPALP